MTNGLRLYNPVAKSEKCGETEEHNFSDVDFISLSKEEHEL
jgi:hypothetical protein